jgi:hypothetical protein
MGTLGGLRETKTSDLLNLTIQPQQVFFGLATPSVIVNQPHEGVPKRSPRTFSLCVAFASL